MTDIMTRRKIQKLVCHVLDAGGSVSRVLISRKRWREFLEDCLPNEILSPTLVLIWNLPIQPSDLLDGEDARTEQ